MSLVTQLNDAVPKMLVTRSIVSLSMGASSLVASASASRWGIGFSSPIGQQTTSGILLDVEPIDQSNLSGWNLGAQLPPLWFYFRRHGVLVTSAWYGLSQSGPTAITVWTLDMIDYNDK